MANVAVNIGTGNQKQCKQQEMCKTVMVMVTRLSLLANVEYCILLRTCTMHQIKRARHATACGNAYGVLRKIGMEKAETPTIQNHCFQTLCPLHCSTNLLRSRKHTHTHSRQSWLRECTRKGTMQFANCLSEEHFRNNTRSTMNY